MADGASLPVGTPTFRTLSSVVMAGALWVGALGPTLAEGQEIRGIVTADASGEPLPGVRVWLQSPEGLAISLAMTTADGSFRIRPEDPGEYRIRLTRIGYLERETERLSLAEGEVLELSLEMNLDPVRLPGIEVQVEALPAYEVHRATYTGLYMRRGDSRWATPGGNRVFVGADLEPHTGATVREFIERYAPLNIQTQLRRQRQYERDVIRAEMMGQRRPSRRTRGCAMPSFLIRGVQTDDLIEEIYLDMPLREIEGIEFYRRSTEAPLELRSGGDCGVVVIWPRQAGELR